MLTYADPTETNGKPSAESDVVEVRFLEIVPNDRMVQAVNFVADDPVGISAEDHAVGLASSLNNLARHLES